MKQFKNFSTLVIFSIMLLPSLSGNAQEPTVLQPATEFKPTDFFDPLVLSHFIGQDENDEGHIKKLIKKYTDAESAALKGFDSMKASPEEVTNKNLEIRLYAVQALALQVRLKELENKKLRSASRDCTAAGSPEVSSRVSPTFGGAPAIGEGGIAIPPASNIASPQK